MKLSIEQPLLNSRVSVDPAVAQKWPVRPMFVHPRPINFSDHDLLFLDRTFGDDLAVRSANKTLPPKFNSIAAGGRFMTDAVRCGNVATVRDRVTPLDRLPRIVLRRPEFPFLPRMPTNCRRIKNNLGAA